MGRSRSLGWTSWPAWVVVLNVLVASGFALAGLIRPSAVLPATVDPTMASAIFGLYAAARTIPLAVAVFVAIIRSDDRALVVLALLAGVIQFLDGLIGIAQHDSGKTLGPLVLAALTFFAAHALARGWPRTKISHART